MKQPTSNLQNPSAQSHKASLAIAKQHGQVYKLKALLLLTGLILTIEPAQALPSPDDTPEEVLRSEIITGARSPIDGKPITASEYAQLQAELQEPGPSRPQVGRSLEKNLNLLRLRKFIKTFFPFLPVP
jgi:hypothetical protein